MNADTFIAFIVTSFLITASPGPIIIYGISSVLERGLSNSLIIIPAVLLGDLCVMVLSLSGVGAHLSTWPIMFTAIKALGAIALLGLGVYGIWRTTLTPSHQEMPAIVISFPAAFTLAALHPGAIVFYAAFFPQFLSPSGNALLQTGILGAIFLITAFVTIISWMSAAAIFKQSIKTASQLTLFKATASGIMIVIGAAGLIASVRGLP